MIIDSDCLSKSWQPLRIKFTPLKFSFQFRVNIQTGPFVLSDETGAAASERKDFLKIKDCLQTTSFSLWLTIELLSKHHQRKTNPLIHSLLIKQLPSKRCSSTSPLCFCICFCGIVILSLCQCAIWSKSKALTVVGAKRLHQH